MSSQPLVSVVINNHNYGRYLAEALQSALDQSYRNLEVIVVDDGSTDDSRSVLQSYQRRYPGRFLSICKENGGQASAMNRGFAASRGEIVCFLDSDDYWFGAKVEKVVPFHREFGIVQHNLLQNGRRYRLLMNTGDLQRFLKEFGFVRSCVPTSALSFHRDLLDRFFPMPEEPLRLCADVYLRCAAVYFSPVFSMDDCLGVYRLHGSNGWHDGLRLTNPGIAGQIIEVLNADLRAQGLAEIPRRRDSPEQAFLHSIPIVSGGRYILYGAGAFGVKLGRKILNQGCSLVAYCDGSEEKWGRQIHGATVYGPDELPQLRPLADKIIVACTLVERIYEMLGEMGFRYPEDLVLPIDLEGHVTNPPVVAEPQQAFRAQGHCPVCGRDVERWLPFTRKVGEGKYREEPGGRLCPHCRSFERTRHMWLFLQGQRLLSCRPRFLHVAPEPGLQQRLREHLGPRYTAVDLSAAGVDGRVDLRRLPFRDDSFDFIYCSNVLEHIVEDRRAMGELCRVLDPDGLAILQVPLRGDVTQEDPRVVAPEERTRLYGQADHVRMYGRDFRDRLAAAGFSVQELSMPDCLGLGSSETRRFNCGKRELVHACRKQPRPTTSGEPAAS